MFFSEVMFVNTHTHTHTHNSGNDKFSYFILKFPLLRHVNERYLITTSFLVYFCVVQKKSREESRGTDSGVEIIENKPYTNGPGGSGQYTFKIYHIGSHLPGKTWTMVSVTGLVLS